MRKFAATLLVLGGLMAPLAAQQDVPSPVPVGTRLAWDHSGVNVDGYSLTVDAAGAITITTTPIPGGFSTPFPSLTPGVHNLAIRAFNVAGSSGPATLTVRVIVVPADPTNLRIVILNESGDRLIWAGTVQRRG